LGSAGCVRGRARFRWEEGRFEFVLLLNGPRSRQPDNIGEVLSWPVEFHFESDQFGAIIHHSVVNTK
jgi:hypothetical protein